MREQIEADIKALKKRLETCLPDERQSIEDMISFLEDKLIEMQPGFDD